MHTYLLQLTELVVVVAPGAERGATLSFQWGERVYSVPTPAGAGAGDKLSVQLPDGGGEAPAAAASEVMCTAKRARKKRSDAGVKRGPRDREADLAARMSMVAYQRAVHGYGRSVNWRLAAELRRERPTVEAWRGRAGRTDAAAAATGELAEEERDEAEAAREAAEAAEGAGVDDDTVEYEADDSEFAATCAPAVEAAEGTEVNAVATDACEDVGHGRRQLRVGGGLRGRRTAGAAAASTAGEQSAPKRPRAAAAEGARRRRKLARVGNGRDTAVVR